MKILSALILLASLFTVAAFAQDDEDPPGPILEKEFTYKNFKLPGVRDGRELDLREAISGKKLALVVYFAPWCHNWKHEAPMVEKLYKKYKANGFEVIGVSEYDSVGASKVNLDDLGITFPVVYESDAKEARKQTTHFKYRVETGDTRGWGSPWNVFLIPSEIKPKGDKLTKKAFVSNGELIEAEAEAFIRERLGLPKIDAKPVTSSTSKPGEVCDPATTLKKP